MMIHDPNGPHTSLILDVSRIPIGPRTSLILDVSRIPNAPCSSLILNVARILDASLIPNAHLSSTRVFTGAHKYAKV
jgi:hypothetical protein